MEKNAKTVVFPKKMRKAAILLAALSGGESGI